MSTRQRLTLLSVLLQVVLLSLAAHATVIEAWRGGAPTFNSPNLVAVNATDGSCWMVQLSADLHDRQLLHLAQDGAVLWQSALMPGAFGLLSINPTDGSCWTTDGESSLIHLAEDGSVLWQGGSFTGLASISVNAADGSCWVLGRSAGQIVHLAADGTELWRGDTYSPYPSSLAVNPSDGTYWIAYPPMYGGETGTVIHYAPDGAELWQSGDTVLGPTYVAVNPTNSSCWVAQSTGQVVHLAEDGTVLWQSSGDPIWAYRLSVNPVDGSCWAAQSSSDVHGVIHLAQDGAVLWQSAGVATVWPTSVAVNPTDGSCWVADTGRSRVVHLDRTGAELWRSPGYPMPLPSFLPSFAAVNSADGSCWISDSTNGWAMHLAQDGSVLWTSYLSTLGLSAPSLMSVSATDGSLWVATGGVWDNGAVVSSGPTIARLDAAGNLLWAHWYSRSPFSAISANPADESCWVTWASDPAISEAGLSHLDENGNELATGGVFFGNPTSLSVNSTDGSVWVADAGYNTIAHVASDDTALWTSAPVFSSPSSVSVNATDGSAWVADTGHNQIVHLASGGTELWRSGATFSVPEGVSVDTTDGSCWVTDAEHNRIVHLASDGSELWNSAALWASPAIPTFSSPSSVAADASTGSCWVMDAGHGQLVRLATFAPVSPAADFAVTPASGLAPLTALFTDQSTGNLGRWEWSFGDGASSTAWNPQHQYPLFGNYTVTLTVTDAGGSETATHTGNVLVGFSDLGTDNWALDQILACANAGIVGGYPDGSYQPTNPVTRDQMAVYIARAVAGGDAAVPTGPETASFEDVPNTGYGESGTDPYWAYRYIEYCVAQGVVQGYPDGTYHPEEEVNRGQMAVYIARSIATPTGEAGVPEVPAGASPSFTDVNADNEWAWCYKHVEYCAAEGVVQGYWDGSYRPEAVVTRDQMAVYVARAFALEM
jgi:PKD repeat protein